MARKQTVKSFRDLTGADLRRYRAESGLSETKFWAPIGVLQSVGHAYEAGGKMPESVRRLVWLQYVIGIDVEALPEELLAIVQTRKLAVSAAVAMTQARSEVQAALRALDEAVKTLSA